MKKGNSLHLALVLYFFLSNNQIKAEELSPCLTAIDAFKATLVENKANRLVSVEIRKNSFADLKTDKAQTGKDKSSAFRTVLIGFKDSLLAQKDLRKAALEVVKESCGLKEKEDEIGS